MSPLHDANLLARLMVMSLWTSDSFVAILVLPERRIGQRRDATRAPTQLRA